MADAGRGGWKGDWEQRLQEAGERAELEVRRVVRYLNDEVVPEVRQEGSKALRTAAEQLLRLAEELDRPGRAGSAGAAGSRGDQGL